MPVEGKGLNKTFKPKEQLLRELGEMRSRLEQLEVCAGEFRNVQERYQKMLEAAPDAMVFVDSNFEI